MVVHVVIFDIYEKVESVDQSHTVAYISVYVDSMAYILGLTNFRMVGVYVLWSICS